MKSSATAEEPPEKGMGDRIYEVMERPQSPSEAALFHEIETLKKRLDWFCKGQLKLNYELKKRLDDLEAQKRPGDD